jgi:pantetheine-phosphate adenylyltransferase
MSELVKDIPCVKVALWDGLIVEFAAKAGAKVIIRGVRAVMDFGYEFELSMINKGLNHNIETLFMPTDPKYFVLRSSSIKELVQLGGDVSEMIPKNVENALRKQLKP